MKVVDLDGKIYNLNLANSGLIHQNKSLLHLQVRELLHLIFPTVSLLEEIPIHIRKNQIAYLDFYIPLRKIAVEVNGEQHVKFIPHFHHTMAGFIQSQKKDRDKEEFCRINNIVLVKLLYNESLDEWKKKLI